MAAVVGGEDALKVRKKTIADSVKKTIRKSFTYVDVKTKIRIESEKLTWTEPEDHGRQSRQDRA